MRFLQRITEGHNVIRTCMKRVCGDTVLLYRLTEEAVNADTGRKRYMYSLTVTQIDHAGERRKVVHLKDISRSRPEALRIYSLMSRGTVFPDNAAEIAEELISI